jgi:hypothetical protein
MGVVPGDPVAVVARELERRGLLLLHDKRLPSVSLLVAGEPVPGSWWSHPRGADIFAASEAIDDREDVVAVKLVAGKVTFVQRALWPALVGVATSGEPWQRRGLSRPAQALWEHVDAGGSVRSDSIEGPRPAERVRELEARLLVLCRQIHTESGRHAKVLESWKDFADRTGVKPLVASEARAALEQAADRLADGRRPKLPWDSRRR